MLGMEGYIPSAEELLREWSPVCNKSWTGFLVAMALIEFCKRHPHEIRKAVSVAFGNWGNVAPIQMG